MDEENKEFETLETTEEDEFLEQNNSRKKLRIISLVLVITLVVVFVMPQIIFNIPYIQMLFGDQLSTDEVENLINDFESNYLYSEELSKKEYLEAKNELLKKESISKLEFKNFIDEVTKGSGDQYTYFLYKDNKTINPVHQIESRIINDEYIYLKLYRFSNGITKEIREQLQAYDENEIIIDLRDNPGGSLVELINLLEDFLPREVQALSLSKNNQQQLYVTQENKIYNFDKIYILLNENSASSAEVFALSIHLNLPNVELVGNKTAGKSVVQIERTSDEQDYQFLFVTHQWFVYDHSTDYLNKLLSQQTQTFSDYDDYINYILDN